MDPDTRGFKTQMNMFIFTRTDNFKRQKFKKKKHFLGRINFGKPRRVEYPLCATVD